MNILMLINGQSKSGSEEAAALGYKLPPCSIPDGKTKHETKCIVTEHRVVTFNQFLMLTWVIMHNIIKRYTIYKEIMATKSLILALSVLLKIWHGSSQIRPNYPVVTIIYGDQIFCLQYLLILIPFVEGTFTDLY